MKMKLDENIGQRGKALLMEAGHDVCTILEQNLQSAPDPSIERGSYKRKARFP
jgi:Domain of unknown function (DUF5615)